MRIPLLYALHSGNLYGTERMALATAQALTDQFTPIICAPPGPALDEGRRRGLATRAFNSPWQFARIVRTLLAGAPTVACVCTGVSQSLICSTVNAVYRRKLAHLHIVHGGTDEALSYGRKKHLLPFDVSFVAVSAFVQQRLVAHGVPARRVQVIENFLSPAQVPDPAPANPANTGRIERIAVVSRIDPIKRIDLLLDALDRFPRLSALSFRILGSGWELDTLRQRAAATHPNVEFLGFSEKVQQELLEADLLLHLCPEEPFGLAILEAMAVGLPVLVPDQGGAGSLITDGQTGFHFKANDTAHLAARLVDLAGLDVDRLKQVAAAGRAQLFDRFSATARSADYGRLLTEKLQ